MNDKHAAEAAAARYARDAAGEAADAGWAGLSRWQADQPAHERAWQSVLDVGTQLDRVADQPEIAALVERAWLQTRMGWRDRPCSAGRPRSGRPTA